MSKMSKSRKRALTCVLSVMLFVCMLASSTFTAYAINGAAAEAKSSLGDAAEPSADGTQDNAPANITDADVAKMSIKFYANGISYNSEATASGLDYTIGELQGDDASGYSTTVTFRFVPGDAFETKVKGLIKNKASASWQGAWGYNFTSARPAEQTVKLLWNGTKWSARYANGSFAGNLPGGTAKVIIVEISLFRTVKYTDGVNGEAFPEQSYTVANGAATPAFNGTPVRAGYTFAGWDPEPAQKVTADAVYTAKWTEDETPVVDKKPENITSADVEGMKIRVYAVGTESMGFSEMLSLTPALGAKGVAYTIGEVEKDANGDWYTTVTFRFASGDAFEAALRESLNTDNHLEALEGWDGWKGDWSYYFGEYTGSAANGAARAAEQTLRLKWISDGEDSGHWQAVYENGTLAENNTAAVANIIKVNAVLPCTVKYTDGANGEVFAEQVYNTYKGAATPAFNGTCEREDYTFAGWNPDVSAYVGGDTVYTAKWGKTVPDKPAKGTVLKDLFIFRCTADPAHTDQISNGGSYITYNNDVIFDQTRGVYTATAKITNVQTLLSFGTKCPNKVWGKNHYHTDKDGATVRTELIRLVWKPTATGTNSAGSEVTGLWMPDGEQFIDVWCATAPSAPTIGGSFKNYLGSTTAIRVIDSLDETKFEITYFRYLTEGTYTFGEVTKDENGDFWCELKIDPAAYAEKFNEKYTGEPAYRIDTVKTTSNFVYKLKYIGDKVNYKQDGSGWTVDSSSYLEGETSKQGKVLYVARQYSITYTDGVDDEEIFPDQIHYAKPGDATPDFSGTPTRTNYDFVGWEPEVAGTVTQNAVYKAVWTPSTKNKPRNITKTAVDKMNIRAYAEGTETFNPGSEMSSCAPTIKAKGVKYVIGEVEGNDVIGYTTTVTFYFISGDKFEAAARNVFNTNKAFGGSTSDKNWPLWKGDWSYSFNEARPAEQTLTLYWGKYQGRNSWTTLINGKPTGNITAAVANFIKVNLKLERTVKYVDGVNGEAFEEQSYTVRNGAETPAFEGTPTREGYTFAGWEPAAAQTVYEDATYTAKWTANSYTLVRDSNGGAELEEVDVVYGTPYGDVIISSARAGYTEDGWYLVTEDGVSNIRIDAESVVSIAGKHTIFLKRSIAQASVSITADRESSVFDAAGRTLTAVHDEYEGLAYSYQWYKDGVLIEGANGKTLSLAGNVSDSGNYSVVLSVTNAENSTVVTENEKVIANAAITLTVEKADNTLIYNYNGADAQEAFDTTKESSITVDGAKEITREGYTFIGWNTASDGSGESYNAQDEYVFAQDNGNGMVSATLYAQWKANEYSITFNAEDASLSFTEKTVIYGEKVGEFPTASRKGYKLVWKDEAGNTVDENTVYTVVGNSVYTGVWELDPSQDTADTDTAVYMLMAAGSLVCLAAAYVLRRRREN